ncbi:hypothetical protein A943_11450 [Bacillus sp. CPSM8]|nr:hypothetical protein A943_11450 [Bacillus sp. CPSM8]
MSSFVCGFYLPAAEKMMPFERTVKKTVAFA